MFQSVHILRFRNQYPDGLVIAHPECSFEVCRQSDFVGSTEHIVRTITETNPNTRWLVGTELNLVNRLAEEVKAEGKIVQFMAPTACMCSTMQRINPQHLAWTLENLADGKVVNQIKVPEHERELAKVALETVLAVYFAGRPAFNVLGRLQKLSSVPVHCPGSLLFTPAEYGAKVSASQREMDCDKPIAGANGSRILRGRGK